MHNSLASLLRFNGEKNKTTLNNDMFAINLIPRAHVSFGQWQDAELWNNQFPECKILGLAISQRMCALF